MTNPNAIVGAGAAGVGGQIVLEVTSWFGWTVSTGLAIWIAAGIAGVVLFIGRDGLVGVWELVRYGSNGKPVARPKRKPAAKPK